MRRLAGLSLLTVVATMLPPLGGTPASAVTRTKVVGCRSAKPNCWPTAFGFTPDGSNLFYVERFTGHIRVKDLSSGEDRLWKKIKVGGATGEQGLLGLAVDPAWPTRQRVFVYVTRGSPLRNHIVRITKIPGEGFDTAGIARIPAATYHNGGVIHFGPDGRLWAVTGDRQRRRLAQRRSSLAGKVLRLTKSGAAAPGNPDGRRWWSRGHRNSFGFAFDPVSGNPWQTENGPECNDEINRIRRGGNYGWGLRSRCPNTDSSGPNPIRPRVRINPVIAPTGAAFCDACGLGSSYEGTLLVGSYNDKRIRRYTLSSDRRSVVAKHRIYQHVRPVLAVEAAPDGVVYFSDRRGIYRLVPG